MFTCFASVNSRTCVRRNKRARRAFFFYHPYSPKRTMKGDLGLKDGRGMFAVRAYNLKAEASLKHPKSVERDVSFCLTEGKVHLAFGDPNEQGHPMRIVDLDINPSPHPVGRDDRLRPKHAFSNFSYFTIETPQSAPTTRNSSSIHFRSKPTSAATLTLDSAATPARVPESSVASRLSAAIRRKRVSC